MNLGIQVDVSMQRKPFLLRGLAQWLAIFDDPDSRCLVDAEDSFATGVPLGVDKPLPRSPQVFPEKVKHRKLDESEYNSVATNYTSGQLSSGELEKKFREEEDLGRRCPSSLPVLQQEYGADRVRVASMAAIVKPDGLQLWYRSLLNLEKLHSVYLQTYVQLSAWSR